MLFLITSAPDTPEFKTAFQMARDVSADICLLQNAVYAAQIPDNQNVYVLRDDMQLRGISDSEITGTPINYGMLVDLMTGSDKVVGLF